MTVRKVSLMGDGAIVAVGLNIDGINFVTTGNMVFKGKLQREQALDLAAKVVELCERAGHGVSQADQT